MALMDTEKAVAPEVEDPEVRSPAVATEELVRDYDITPQPVMTSSGRTTRIPVPSGPLPVPRIIEEPFRVLPTPPA